MMGHEGLLNGTIYGPSSLCPHFNQKSSIFALFIYCILFEEKILLLNKKKVRKSDLDRVEASRHGPV